jgi:hypothetical protein
MEQNTNTGCRACHEQPAGEWCDYHERTLRPRVDPLNVNPAFIADLRERGGDRAVELFWLRATS